MSRGGRASAISVPKIGRPAMNARVQSAPVAEQLDLSPRTVLRWVERGDQAAVRLPGGRLRISKADLAAALERWATTPRRMLAAVGDEGGDAHAGVGLRAGVGGEHEHPGGG